jgi:hypothetical protein
MPSGRVPTPTVLKTPPKALEPALRGAAAAKRRRTAIRRVI